MFAEFVANYVPAIVAAIVLLPVLVFSLAMFLEGARKLVAPDWQKRPHSAARARRNPGARVQPSTAGGLGLRHGIAAPNEHD